MLFFYFINLYDVCAYIHLLCKSILNFPLHRCMQTNNRIVGAMLWWYVKIFHFFFIYLEKKRLFAFVKFVYRDISLGACKVTHLSIYKRMLYARAYAWNIFGKFSYMGKYFRFSSYTTRNTTAGKFQFWLWINIYGFSHRVFIQVFMRKPNRFLLERFIAIHWFFLNVFLYIYINIDI